MTRRLREENVVLLAKLDRASRRAIGFNIQTVVSTSAG